MILEACVESFEEALKAQQQGAQRIELCSRLDLDGLTPSPDLIHEVCSELKIPVMVMIRPRGGDFVYSPNEIKQMANEIVIAKSFGASGIVFGMLTAINQVDTANCKLLTAAASPLPVTFHKAVDLLEDPAEGVRQLLKVKGITRILTSGGKPTAKEGTFKIREMIKEAGDEIIILVAGKVTNENVEEIRQLTGASEFHGRKIVGELNQVIKSGFDSKSSPD
jgi:copper homeostasis protein